MSSDRRAIDQLRKALERNLSSAETSALLFEALASWEGPVPSDIDTLLKLVNGPLVEALIRRSGAATAKNTATEILKALGKAESLRVRSRTNDASDLSEDAGDLSIECDVDDPDATQAVPIARDPVEVAVLASSEHFANRLLAVLGPRRIRSTPLQSPKQLATLEPIPALVVVDSQDFPICEPPTLVDTVKRLPRTTSVLLWGAHLPYGRMVTESFEKASVPLVLLTKQHGIAPLLDLIRSRRVEERRHG